MLLAAARRDQRAAPPFDHPTAPLAHPRESSSCQRVPAASWQPIYGELLAAAALNGQEMGWMDSADLAGAECAPLRCVGRLVLCKMLWHVCTCMLLL